MPRWLVRVDSTCRRCALARLLPVALLICGAAGCRMMSGVEYAKPSYTEQNQAVLKLAPYGTTRRQAVEALQRAGVQGSFGVSESVYYCDVWDRSDGRHWHLDVALFFDQSGRLYKVGPSQTNVGIANSAAENETPGDAGGRAQPMDVSTPASTPATSSRNGRRTPFADPDGFE